VGWQTARRRKSNTTLLYHDPGDPGRAFLAFGVDEDDPARQLARREEMAENLRLFYVAVTRAKQRCYLVWGKIKEAETAPPAWLLHHPPVIGPSQDALQVTKQRFKDLTPAAFLGDLRTAFAAAGETVAIAPLPRESGQRYQPPPVAETRTEGRAMFARRCPSLGGSAAFTALSAGQSGEMPRYDMAATAPEAVEGARAGSRSRPRHLRLSARRPGGNLPARDFRAAGFHSTKIAGRLEALVERMLKWHGLDAIRSGPERWRIWSIACWRHRWTRAVCGWRPSRRSGGSTRWSFTYPLANLRADALRRVLERHGYAAGPFRDMIETWNSPPCAAT
jgi:exodeoxyribonuclease V beta subunit